jgi:hypothetical protein
VYSKTAENPFGLSFYDRDFNTENGRLPLGFISWLRDGGIIGFTLAVLSYFFLLPMLFSMLKADSKSWALASGFIAYGLASNINASFFTMTIFLYIILLSRQSRLSIYVSKYKLKYNI